MKMQPTNFPSSTVLLLVSVKSIAANSVERPPYETKLIFI